MNEWKKKKIPYFYSKKFLVCSIFQKKLNCYAWLPDWSYETKIPKTKIQEPRSISVRYLHRFRVKTNSRPPSSNILLKIVILDFILCLVISNISRNYTYLFIHVWCQNAEATHPSLARINTKQSATTSAVRVFFEREAKKHCCWLWKEEKKVLSLFLLLEYFLTLQLLQWLVSV
jgi:hypothetical protein